jgi:hypothetical protein
MSAEKNDWKTEEHLFKEINSAMTKMVNNFTEISSLYMCSDTCSLQQHIGEKVEFSVALITHAHIDFSVLLRDTRSNIVSL